MLNLFLVLKTSPIEKKEPVSKASEIMQEKKIPHIAVTNKGKIVGILSVKYLEKCWTNWK